MTTNVAAFAISFTVRREPVRAAVSRDRRGDERLGLSAARSSPSDESKLVNRLGTRGALAGEQRAQLAAALRNVAAFDHHRRAVGARPIAVEIVEPIDWASLLRYSIFASRRDLNVLRGVVDGMVRADPRLRREAENVRAPIRVATRIQRAWRARRRRGAVVVPIVRVCSLAGP